MDEKYMGLFLDAHQIFSFKEFQEYVVLNNQNVESERNLHRRLRELQNSGQVEKLSRGQYITRESRRKYQYKASGRMDELTGVIRQKYPLVTFQTWELFQWNEFVNHQLGHNVHFVEVERELVETVFDFLVDRYPRVLINPDQETFYRYFTDDLIVVQQLISSPPPPIEGTKQASLEKLLVDLFSKKLTGQIIERAEYPAIYEDAFGKYSLNEKAMFRYAKRRSLDDIVYRFIEEETNISLKLEERHD